MKNWKTTLGGWVFGLYPAITALSAAYTAGYFTDLTGWKLAFGIAVIVGGVFLKDPKAKQGIADDPNNDDLVGGRPDER